ncbi:MAG TPA: DUF1028 domain-containing protein [Dehalococcoidia bacterium]|nr:DUF1028 domain-containing protein [Dehalococcoidia bacterium]
MTFSIAARDPETGDFGVAVQSKFPAVGSAVPWVRADSGAIATQAWANLSYGPDGLALLAQGESADDVVGKLTSADEGRDHRQLGIVDHNGNASAYTGSACMDWAGHVVGDGFTCQGNILAGESVVNAMAEAYRSAPGKFPERLLAALHAGQREGGDKRGQQSAALYVAREKGSYGNWLDRYIDLRVDDHEAPIDEITRLLKLHRLYFPGETAQEAVAVDSGLAAEIGGHLTRLGYPNAAGAGSLADVSEEFRAWVAVENLEDRMLEGEQIDRVVLDFMREKASGR